jgi:hypothetical protein
MVDGEVEITLDGKSETLRCTLPAARAVNAISGGFLEVYSRLAAIDFEAYVLVVAAGLNKKPADVETAVYKNGLPMLTAPLSEFVGMLANGGKRKKDAGETPAGEA